MPDVVVLRAVIRQHAGRQFHLAHLPVGTTEPDGWHEIPIGSVRTVCGAAIPNAAVIRRRARHLCSRCRREASEIWLATDWDSAETNAEIAADFYAD